MFTNKAPDDNLGLTMGLRGTLYFNRSRGTVSKPARFKVKSLFWLLLLLPFLWVGYRDVMSYFVQPQAMLVLGGDPERENFAADFARQHPNVPIWVSGVGNPESTKEVFVKAGISPERVYIDQAALDTVTNFTTLVDKLRAKGINSVYLITSDYHMRRARVIGEIVFGSRGIYLRPVSVPSKDPTESFPRALRDGARAILWVTTGHTGASLSRRYESRY
ncbi:YdcF family protein [Kovacikia minuta CCNUW1]|uniref:YdcF family protein n=1 Tax=Kovacikia minuta TaxID=2931930 RepID=UPI001CCD02E9|nr:YdcF family protein [Kovacikia minuta]UBF28904.1 YdcF family protein [Kovacikia minuta CCNUW1]